MNTNMTDMMNNNNENISINRPITERTNTSLDIKQFCDFLRGNLEGVDNDSFYVPNDVLNSIDEKIKILSPIKSIANIQYTSFDKIDVIVDLDSKNTSGWVKDNECMKEPSNNIMRKTINLHQLFARPRVTQMILEDSESKIEEFINNRIITHMAALENKAFLKGDGISEPRGILTYGFSYSGFEHGKIEAIKTGEYGKINSYNQLVNVMELLPSEYLNNAVWLMSRNAASAIKNIKDETTGRFVWQNSILSGTPDTLLGYPVVISDDMDRLSISEPTTPVLFGNFYEGYQIAEKPEIKLLKDPYNAKPFIEFYATKFIGGDVVNFNAIKALRSDK